MVIYKQEKQQAAFASSSCAALHFSTLFDTFRPFRHIPHRCPNWPQWVHTSSGGRSWHARAEYIENASRTISRNSAPQPSTPLPAVRYAAAATGAYVLLKNRACRRRAAAFSKPSGSPERGETETRKMRNEPEIGPGRQIRRLGSCFVPVGTGSRSAKIKMAKRTQRLTWVILRSQEPGTRNALCIH